ncbi:hypothetical protein BSFA1_03890 [Burkholderia sp. SFA1]|nr:hypothetical protein BSFA1_03890 [Burkholderia sp. SFA1]
MHVGLAWANSSSTSRGAASRAACAAFNVRSILARNGGPARAASRGPAKARPEAVTHGSFRSLTMV